MFIDDIINLLYISAAEHENVNLIITGDANEVEEKEASDDIFYPLVVIETPDIELTGDADAYYTRYTCFISVLMNNHDNNYETKKTIFGTCQPIMYQILQRISEEIVGLTRNFEYDWTSAQLDVVFSKHTNRHQGIRATFDIDIQSEDYCYNPAKFGK